MRTLLAAMLSLTLLLGTGCGEGICHSEVYRIRGRVATPTSSGLKIAVAISPSKQPPVVAAVADGQFDVMVSFDKTRLIASRFWYDCGRKPEIVSVSLVDGEKVLRRVDLNPETDFVLQDSGMFVTRRLITLPNEP